MNYSNALFIFAPTIGLIIYFVAMNMVITRIFTKDRSVAVAASTPKAVAVLRSFIRDGL